jgi:hypothetical protein
MEYNPDTGDFIRILDIPSCHVFKGDIAGGLTPEGYISIQIDRTKYSAHRLAWLFMTEQDPAHLSIDHIDRVRTNNRFSNLRLADEKIQGNNRNNNRWVSYQGETQTLAYWSDYFDIEYSLLRSRLEAGMTFPDAISIPIKKGITVLINGEELTVREIAKKYGLTDTCVNLRIRRGLSSEDIIKPVRSLITIQYENKSITVSQAMSLTDLTDKQIRYAIQKDMTLEELLANHNQSI